jgi:hypothetical protein
VKFEQYSHRHGRELVQLLHPELHQETLDILTGLAPFSHGAKKGMTVKEYLRDAFVQHGWEKEWGIELSQDKEDFLDLYKDKIAIEMEWSRFEMFFRDFFRFMLLYERKEIDAGIIVTFDEMAYRRWKGEAKSYKAARASLQKLTDFLNGNYSTVVTVPLWCIGIE